MLLIQQPVFSIRFEFVSSQDLIDSLPRKKKNKYGGEERLMYL